MLLVTQTGSEKFLDVVRQTCFLNAEAMIQVAMDMEKHDHPYFDELNKPAVIDVSPCGYNHMTHASQYAHDPWEALRYHTCKAEGSLFILYNERGEFEQVQGKEASSYLYNIAKEMGFPNIPVLNPAISGSLISFEELLGSVPEHMREVLEKQVISEHGYPIRPGIMKFREYYEREVMTILSFFRCNINNVKVKDDEGNEKYVPKPVTALSIGFGRFDQVRDGASQTTAFFHVSDASPDFEPDVQWNWHLQDTSRWLYAGAIAINYYKNEGEEAKVETSSHH